jgi:hypothetical protein
MLILFSRREADQHPPTVVQTSWCSEEAAMNSRRSGLEWLRKKGRTTGEPTVVSKYYTADEAWPGTPVWWFEFPTSSVASDRFGFLNLLCGVAPNSSEYHHLRVPIELFVARKHDLGLRDGGDKFSLYLSGEDRRLFREIRGDGQIEFGVFKVD